MQPHAHHLLGGRRSQLGSERFQAYDPARGQALSPAFYEATQEEIDEALELAHRAQPVFARTSPEERAAFLERIAEEILRCGDTLLSKAAEETGLSLERLATERDRTVSNLRLFAGVVREGSWVEATIDRAQPERRPRPRPDLRKMNLPLGPVVVFGASNFPLAYSVAGGDTVSALAGGNTVVVKAHPAHPATSELVADAICRAVEECEMPSGVFSMVHGASNRVGIALVEHPHTAAVGFTGSLAGGRALFDAAARRPRPIPVYAEMGSVNPLFVLPRALTERGAEIARGLHQAVTGSVGQVCTCPGLVLGMGGGDFERFGAELAALFDATPAATMLHPGILGNYQRGISEVSAFAAVQVVAGKQAPVDSTKTQGAALLLRAPIQAVLEHDRLGQEVFGPSTLLADARSPDELYAIAEKLEGHLAAMIFGTDEDLEEYAPLLEILAARVGRLIVNGYSVGVELVHATHHGGPYPATTESRGTAVGPDAIRRFLRPVCFQNVPQQLLPMELRNENTRGIWRRVDGELTKAPVS